MNTPKVKHELEVAYGSISGFEEATALMECLGNKAPSCGKKVKEFENAFAQYCGVKYALAVTSATTGLTLCGIAAGAGPGDEIITTPISWIATASAFSTLGVKTVFCDVDSRTLCMDHSHYSISSMIMPPNDKTMTGNAKPGEGLIHMYSEYLTIYQVK